jgi:hypothetical protein
VSILRPYKVNSYRRICDICARPRQIEDIRFAVGVAICTLHPQFRTAQQLNRINARVRPTRILPVPQPKPFAPVDTWTAEESQILNFVTATAPYDTVTVTSNAGAIVGARSYQAYGWAIVYLTSLLAENKRPAAWLTAVRAKAIALGAEVMTFQNAVTTNSSVSGGFRRNALNVGDPNAYYSADNALLCAALCRLYAATGNPSFLGGARGAAHFLANLHATNLWVTGSQPYLGAFPEKRQGTAITADYYPTGLLGLWALTLLQALLGDVTIGQTTTALGSFSSPPAKPISEILAALRAFWGPVTTITGEFFSGGIWINTSPPSDEWATALFALAEVDGISAQVATLWDYLMTFTSAPNIAGTYDPSLALTTVFDTVALRNDSGFYDWGAAGLMAKTCASRNRAAVKRVKDVLAEPRARYVEPHAPRGSELLYLGPLGYSTLAFAPVTSGTTTRQQSVVRASKAGLIYRQQPQGWIGQGH